MGKRLSPESLMECPIHGNQKPAFICQHLQHGSGLGFFTPAEEATPSDPWPQAWCGECERVAIETGEWNDLSEGYAQFRWVCMGCYETTRKRNA